MLKTENQSDLTVFCSLLPGHWLLATGRWFNTQSSDPSTQLAQWNSAQQTPDSCRDSIGVFFVYPQGPKDRSSSAVLLERCSSRFAEPLL